MKDKEQQDLYSKKKISSLIDLDRSEKGFSSDININMSTTCSDFEDNQGCFYPYPPSDNQSDFGSSGYSIFYIVLKILKQNRPPLHLSSHNLKILQNPDLKRRKWKRSKHTINIL